MFNHINWIAVAVASLATFLVGGPWYSPALFGTRWGIAMGPTPMKRGHPARVFGLAYLFSFVAATFLAALLPAGATWLDGLRLGGLVGVCFVATSFGVNYQFANRPMDALLIDGGYHIVQFAVIGAVLGAWHN
jgi:hypothetical protein